MDSRVISVLVENTPGILSRVSGLFSRRGYNIDSFSCGVTADKRYTRMTIVTHGDETEIEQIESQMKKICEVVDIKFLQPGKSITRELMLVKIAVDDKKKGLVLPLIDIFHGKPVDVTHESMIIEISGNSDKLDSFLDMLNDYEILELARTGITGLSRGTSDVVILD